MISKPEQTGGFACVAYMRRCVVVALLAFAMWSAGAANAAELPQARPYQKTLRDYMNTLTEADFDVELKPLQVVESEFATPEAAAKYWMLFLTRVADIPQTEGIRLPSSFFLLSSLEAGEAVNFKPGRGASLDPIDAAWWAQWDYPGNPYFDSKPVKLRAVVAAAVDMMMLDQDHDAGKNKRSDFLGGSMIRFGYAFYVGQDVLPPDARAAYRAGLVRMFEKLEAWTPRGSGGSDMEFFQLPGMWYAAQALGEDYPQRALNRAHVVIDTITSKTGYEKHGGAFDVSYQGIALRFLTWAATLYEDPKINDALHKMLVLKAHLSLPEPDGTLYGPTHFSTGTSMDAPNDQWAWESRDASMAMIDDLAMYTVWSRIGVPSVEGMKARVAQEMAKVDTTTPITDVKPQVWAENHWTRGLNYAHDQYHAGFFKRLSELNAADSPLAHPPFGRDETFIRDLNGGGEFLAVRFENYGAVIHTGAIAKRWASGVSGKSGGSLSAFWMPGRGNVLLGRCRATQGNESDEWTDANGRGPYTWGVHAITGKAKSGEYFSTARIANIESNYAIDQGRQAVVTLTGNVAGADWADPAGVLKGEAPYARKFVLTPAGIEVTSSLTSPSMNEVAELWETFPVFFGDSGLYRTAPKATVEFRVGGQWVPASEEVVVADAVQFSRYDGHGYLLLDHARKVKLSPDVGERSHHRVTIRNVMVDLMGGNSPGAVTYRIAPTL